MTATALEAGHAAFALDEVLAATRGDLVRLGDRTRFAGAWGGSISGWAGNGDGMPCHAPGGAPWGGWLVTRLAAVRTERGRA